MTKSVDALVEDLNAKLAAALAAAYAAGRESALSELRAVLSTGMSGGAPAASAKRATDARKSGGFHGGGTGKSAATFGGKERASHWGKLTPEERLARVNAVRRGSGLPLKTSL